MQNACNLLVIRGHYAAVTLCLYGVIASQKSPYLFRNRYEDTERERERKIRCTHTHIHICSRSPSPYSDSHSDGEKPRSPGRVGGANREKGASPDQAGDSKDAAVSGVFQFTCFHLRMHTLLPTFVFCLTTSSRFILLTLSQDNKAWSSLLDSYNTLFEPFSPDHSPEHSFDFYDDEIPSKRVSRERTNGIPSSLLVHI